jgi:DNA-binding IclR family transcriptional regulator
MSIDKANSAARVLRVMKALKGHSLDGISNGELAKALNESPSAITRALQIMIEENMAIKLDNGRFALSVAALQIAQAHTNELARANQRIAELSQRVSAGSRS